MFAPVAEGMIYYDITDIDSLMDGRPILFVIPGGPGFDHTMYKETSKSFEEFCHVIYYDPRGCGRSNNFEVTSCNMHNHAADIEVIRRHLDLDKINVLGTSYGSMAGMKYGIDHSSS